MDVRFTITPQSQREFRKTLEKYLKVSKRSLPEALNEKAYFILNGSPTTEGAIRLTRKADYQAIKCELGVHSVQQVGKRGKLIKKFKNELMDKYWNQLSVKIIIARLRAAGTAIPSAEELKDMAVKMVNARVRSVAFIRSGWLPALRALARFSKYGKLKFDETGRRIGVAKGGVSIATENRPRVYIWNSAGGEPKHKQAILRYGQDALEQAFRQETASMKSYIEQKLRNQAKDLGIKTN